jgi:hypothetical protein
VHQIQVNTGVDISEAALMLSGCTFFVMLLTTSCSVNIPMTRLPLVHLLLQELIFHSAIAFEISSTLAPESKVTILLFM